MRSAKGGGTGNAASRRVCCLYSLHGKRRAPGFPPALFCSRFFLPGNRSQMGALLLVNKDVGDSLANQYSFQKGTTAAFTYVQLRVKGGDH